MLLLIRPQAGPGPSSWKSPDHRLGNLLRPDARLESPPAPASDSLRDPRSRQRRASPTGRCNSRGASPLSPRAPERPSDRIERGGGRRPRTTSRVVRGPAAVFSARRRSGSCQLTDLRTRPRRRRPWIRATSGRRRARRCGTSRRRRRRRSRGSSCSRRACSGRSRWCA
jgi:hypothetical protein